MTTAIDILEKIRQKIDRNKNQKFIQWNMSQNKFEIESWKCEVLYIAIYELQALWDWWISVTESPKDMELVAVWNNKWKKPMFAYFYKWKRWNYYRTATVDARIIEPTHWMPLPNSPK